MALVKKHVKQVVEELVTYTNLDDATEAFNATDDDSEKDYIIDEIVKFHAGGEFLIDYIHQVDAHRPVSTKIASAISSMDPDEAPIEKIMELLKLENAYIRNLGISMLRDFGDSIKYYIVKFLIGDDRDLRIFAINVLGDVSFSESREMLLELLETEEDINVAMTAVDYMGEIGEVKDIPLLESLKTRFKDEVYVEFAVDGAVTMIKG
ncbi:HEAT repeat domain-containing protein [Sulfurimonas sp. SAG-AH-194-C21]|nr:HEAT repeat domain-containing protein [Sulfurimonas sp. SAG-AH-194-C21]MDF1882760.1 HEAT repeat domain-containing protein [Sulfurimonas sp. SAG-AH-194-C21]